MIDKNIELMKKIIEEKKLKGTMQKNNLRPEKNIGNSSKAYRNTKRGGAFDK